MKKRTLKQLVVDLNAKFGTEIDFNKFSRWLGDRGYEWQLLDDALLSDPGWIEKYMRGEPICTPSSSFKPSQDVRAMAIRDASSIKATEAANRRKRLAEMKKLEAAGQKAMAIPTWNANCRPSRSVVGYNIGVNSSLIERPLRGRKVQGGRLDN